MSAQLGSVRLIRLILDLYGGNAAPLLIVAAALFVPLSLVDAVGNSVVSVDSDSASDVELAGAVGVAVTQGATALLGNVFYSGAVSSIVLGPRVTWTQIRQLARTLPYGRLIAVDVVLTAGLGLGLILLIVPGLVFLTYFALAAPAVELEGRGVRDALRRSRELVRGHFWPVFRILIPLLIVIGLLAELATSGTTALLSDSFAADWLGETLANVLMNPLYGVAVVAIMVTLVDARGELPPGARPRGDRGGSAAPQ